MSDSGGIDFRNALLGSIPQMRRYARALCRNRDRADDLVQETLLKAWEKRDSLAEMQCMKAWLFTILRNVFYAARVRARREIEDVDGEHAARMAVPATQSAGLDLCDVLEAVGALPLAQREALLLVCVEGLSYDEAAAICACAVGTLKSRINRARQHLVHILDIEGELARLDAAAASNLAA